MTVITTTTTMAQQTLSQCNCRVALEFSFPASEWVVEKDFSFKGVSYNLAPRQHGRDTCWEIMETSRPWAAKNPVPPHVEMQFIKDLGNYASPIVRDFFLEKYDLGSYAFGAIGCPSEQWDSLPQEIKDLSDWFDSEHGYQAMNRRPSMAQMLTLLGWE